MNFSSCESHSCRPFFVMLMIKVLTVDVLLTVAPTLVLVHRNHIFPALPLSNCHGHNEVTPQARYQETRSASSSDFACLLFAKCRTSLSISWLHRLNQRLSWVYHVRGIVHIFSRSKKDLSLWHLLAVGLLVFCSTLHYERRMYGKWPGSIPTLRKTLTLNLICTFRTPIVATSETKLAL